MRKSRLIITGANGFLGSHIAQYFFREQYPVLALIKKPSSVLEGIMKETIPDLLENDLVKLFADFNPDVVIHCAGSSSVPFSFEAPQHDFQNSVGLTSHLLNSLVKFQRPCKLIYLSSAAVYGNPAALPIKESDALSPISPYGTHKLLGEQLVMKYSEIFSIDFAILRIFSGYGEFLRKQVVADLFQKFLDPLSSEVSVIGTGDETRDFIHGEDVARAIESVLFERAGCFNVGSGKQTTVKEIVSLIQSVTQISKPVVYSQEQRKGDPRFWQADISKLLLTGFHRNIDLKEGIGRYWDWLRGQ